MAYVKKEDMDKFIDMMIEYGVTPLMLVAPYVEKKYENKNRNPRYVSIPKFAQLLDVSVSTVYRYMDEGMPYFIKEDGAGRYLDKDLCISYLKQKKAVKKKEGKILNDRV